MCDARYRRRPQDMEYGTICPDCASPKAEQATRCRYCWTENVLRAKPAYWQSRTCPDCSGPKYRQSARCRPCTNALMVGRPRSTPVVPAADHKWRRLESAFHKQRELLPTEAA